MLSETHMSDTTVKITFPNELVDLFGSADEAAERAREALVLDLVRNETISQGRAAELLGISRKEMMQLAFRHRIPSGPQTAEELMEEVEAISRMKRPQ